MVTIFLCVYKCGSSWTPLIKTIKKKEFNQTDNIEMFRWIIMYLFEVNDKYLSKVNDKSWVSDRLYIYRDFWKTVFFILLLLTIVAPPVTSSS